MVNSKQVKELLGMRAKEIIETGLSMRVKGKKAHCTNPTAHKNGDKNPSMYWNDKGYSWTCPVCGENIDIFSYFMQHKGMNFMDAMKEAQRITGTYTPPTEKVITPKVYKKPVIQHKTPSNDLYKYFENRGIKKEVVDIYGVTQSVWKERECIVFNYLTAKGSDIEYISYRALNNSIKGGCVENTKPILYGMWLVDVTRPLIITEGQIDAMSIYQAGHTNVVSVPAGCQNLHWIENCWEWLKKIPLFIVFADNDEAGQKMAAEIQIRLKNVEVFFSDKYSDANAMLKDADILELYGFVQKAIEKEPEGLIDSSSIKINRSWENFEGVETGFKEIDRHIEDLKPTELTIVFGRNNEGKSTVLAQMICNFMQMRYPTFLYSGELSDEKLIGWIYRQLIGHNSEMLDEIEAKYRKKYIVNQEVEDALKNWHRGILHLADRSATKIMENDDDFFNMMRIARAKYGIKIFVIDNLMSKMYENANSLYSDQANFTQRCKNFAIANHCHVVLVCHPTKAKDEIIDDIGNQSGNLEKTDISGTNNIANKADNIISVERNFSKNDDVWNAIIKVLKDRNTGQRLEVPYRFDAKTLRFHSKETPKNFHYDFEQLIS